MVGATYLSLFHLEVCRARGIRVFPKWLSAAFWSTVFPMGGLTPSVLQVVEFSDHSFVFAPARDCHNTIFCPFRFKSAAIALFLYGSSLMFFKLFCSLRHSVPLFIARQHFCKRFIVLFVLHGVRTFSYCFVPRGLTWRFLRFMAVRSVFRVISSIVCFIAPVIAVRFIAPVIAVRFMALVIVVRFIAPVIAVRFIALVIVVRFITPVIAVRFIALVIVVKFIAPVIALRFIALVIVVPLIAPVIALRFIAPVTACAS